MNDMFETIRSQIPNIHKEGYIMILGFIIGTLILFAISNTLGWIGVILTMWCFYFFRDPQRVTPIGEGLVISPADGVVQAIEKAPLPPELEMGDEEVVRVSVFLNVFDVHVNRVPIDGVVEKSHYHHGKFFNASLDKASEHNERQSLLIKTEGDEQIGVVQIAGLIARRIVCDLKEGDETTAGERFGIIKFGSRVDVYLPKGIDAQVLVGQRSVGGETILAHLDVASKK